MKTSSYTLIPATQFGVASTVDGNYDGVTPNWSETPQKAASYYKKAKSLQTISWYLSNFEGTLIIEGTLDSDKETASYFPIIPPITTVIEQGDPIVPPITENEAENVDGNFTWIRVRVEDFTAGSITKVSLGY